MAAGDVFDGGFKRTSDGALYVTFDSTGGIPSGTPITGGGANRVLFEDASQNLATDSVFTYVASTDTLSVPVVALGAGAVGAPSLYLSTDTTTGLYRSAANQLGFAVSGVQALNISATGLQITGATGMNVAPSFANLLRVSGAVGAGATQIGVRVDPTASTAATTLYSGFRSLPTMADGSGITYASIRHYETGNSVKSGAGDTITQQSGYVATNFTAAALNVGYEGLLTVSGTARYNLYLSGSAPNYIAGQVFVSHTASVTTGQANRVQISGDGTTVGGLALNRYSADALASRLEFGKSDNATIGSNTIVANGDALGNINFYGANGSTYTIGAAIRANVAGVPGATNDMPGSLTFSATADGAGTVTDVITVASTGATILINNGLKLTSQTTGGAAALGTLTDAPSAGNPDFWLPVTINGTAHWIPAWAA